MSPCKLVRFYCTLCINLCIITTYIFKLKIFFNTSVKTRDNTNIGQLSQCYAQVYGSLILVTRYIAISHLS